MDYGCEWKKDQEGTCQGRNGAEPGGFPWDYDKCKKSTNERNCYSHTFW